MWRSGHSTALKRGPVNLDHEIGYFIVSHRSLGAAQPGSTRELCRGGAFNLLTVAIDAEVVYQCLPEPCTSAMITTGPHYTPAVQKRKCTASDPSPLKRKPDHSRIRTVGPKLGLAAGVLCPVHSTFAAERFLNLPHPSSIQYCANSTHPMTIALTATEETLLLSGRSPRQSSYSTNIRYAYIVRRTLAARLSDFRSRDVLLYH